MAENLYRSKVLMDNWFEDRSDHTNSDHFFYNEQKKDKPTESTLTKVRKS